MDDLSIVEGECRSDGHTGGPELVGDGADIISLFPYAGIPDTAQAEESP